MEITITKTANRLAILDGKTLDIFCGGGKSSKKFCAAKIGATVKVIVTSTDESNLLSNYTVAYLQ